jgi:hypothetical protein
MEISDETKMAGERQERLRQFQEKENRQKEKLARRKTLFREVSV